MNELTIGAALKCWFLSLIIYVRSDEITEQVLDVGPKYIFTATDSLGKVEKAVKRCDQVKVGISNIQFNSK